MNLSPAEIPPFELPEELREEVLLRAAARLYAAAHQNSIEILLRNLDGFLIAYELFKPEARLATAHLDLLEAMGERLTR